MICRSSSGRMNHICWEVEMRWMSLVSCFAPLAARMHLQTCVDTVYVTGDRTSHHNHARNHTRDTCIHVPVNVHMRFGRYPHGCYWLEIPIAT